MVDVEYHAIADVALDPIADDAGRHQIQLVDLFADDQRVAGIVPALETHHPLRMIGQPVDDLALALVAPLSITGAGRQRGKTSQATARGKILSWQVQHSHFTTTYLVDSGPCAGQWITRIPREEKPAGFPLAVDWRDIGKQSLPVKNSASSDSTVRTNALLTLLWKTPCQTVG